MIITRTPFRVSFVGGGSDLREFYSRNGYGAVVSAAIKKYMYIIIHPYFHDKIRIKYSSTEDVYNIDDIKHPIVRECLKKVQIHRGIEIASIADIPSGTGLGSSSAFTVGLLNALYAYQGKIVSKERLAQEACEIEIDMLGEPIGKQDQYAAACGNLNYLRFNKDESVEVTPVVLSQQMLTSLESSLMLYYTGGSRNAGSILTEQRHNITDEYYYNMLKQMTGFADELYSQINNGEIESLGKMLDKGWLLKRGFSAGVTNDNIDSLYNKAIEHGATGGKLLGAGGSGFLLIYSKDHDAIKEQLGCRYFPFEIDREGSKVIFYDENRVSG